MIQHLCFALLLSLFSHSLHAKVFDQLGQRPNRCGNPGADTYNVTLSKAFLAQAQQLFNSDQLTEILVAPAECLRVGSEIKLNLSGTEISYLGRAFVDRIETLSGQEVLSLKNSVFSKKSRQDFVAEMGAKVYAQVKIRFTERAEESVITTDFMRLPTCFPSNSDWEKYKLEGPNNQNDLQQIKTGTKRADIWNGTMNCYKVGVRAKVFLIEEDESATHHGFVIPRKLSVIHYTKLTEQHAKYFNVSLNELKSELAAEKDKDGGYVTMVVFDFETLSEETLGY